MANDLVKTNEKAVSLRNFLHNDRIKDQLSMALPKWLSVDRMLRIVFSSAVRNPRLLECSQESILQSVMMCAQLGLEPILGRAYLIPYNNSKQVGGRWTKVMECQFQPGYQGLVDLARRSGVIQDVYGAIVHEKDEFDFTLGTDRKIHHRPTLEGEPGKPIGAYAVWELKDGLKHPEFMTMHQINKRRDRSQAWQYAQKNPSNKSAQDCPWVQWPDEMALKTVVKYSSKLVPASIEFMEAVSMDDSTDIGQRYVSPFMDSVDQIPEKTTVDLEADFDRLAAAALDTDLERVDFEEFVESVAKRSGVSVQVAKADVIKGEDFNGILEAFRKVAPDRTAAGHNAPRVENPFLDRKSWVNLKQGSQEKGTGFAVFVKANKVFLADVPIELFGEIQKKYEALYAVQFPFTPDGEEIDQGDGSDDTGKAPDTGAGKPDVGGLMESPEARSLAEMGKRYPKAYAQVVKNRVPESVDQLQSWIDEIQNVAEFTNEGGF